MWGSDFPVEGESVLIKWDPAVTLTPRANYMFVRCSQTTIHTTHLIPTSTATPLAAPSAYWQERCRSQKGGGGHSSRGGGRGGGVEVKTGGNGRKTAVRPGGQRGCRSQKGGGAIAPGGEDEEGEVKWRRGEKKESERGDSEGTASPH